MKYCEMTPEQLAAERASLQNEYEELKAKGLKLNMARGVLCSEQLELTHGMLNILSTKEDCFSEAGTDCRNYGVLDGLPEMKKIFADMLEVPAECLIVGGNASLNLMYDTVARNMLYGTEDVKQPWAGRKIKFLCPVPGYDRHFSICESLGIEMINVPLNEDGPDMDIVEELVSKDDSIKGMWCVPKYANPTGDVYSDAVITRLASMKPAAKDFRIMWDNAYVVHSLYGEPAKQLNILEEVKKYGNDNMVYVFASTSKISFPGSGVAVMASSAANIAAIKKVMGMQTIGHDKLNQLRHVRYFGSMEGISEQMKRHAAIIAPKFKLVDKVFTERLGDLDIATWTKPMGGYFISLDVPEGCAAKVYGMMSELGVTLTPAGATYPYRRDPKDSNLRIAPTFPPLAELEQACEALCLCVKLAAAEQALA